MKRKDFDIVEDSGKTIKLSVRFPLQEDYETSERIYAGKIASLVRESGGKRLLLRSQVNDFLKSAGIWSEEDEKQVEKINKEIDAMLNKLRQGGKKASEGRQICIDIMDKRKEVVKINSKKQIFDDTTIESIAENERLDYLIYACTVYAETGNNYWESFEDMKNDKLSQAYQKAMVAAYDVIFNVNAEFEKNLPENKWLIKYNFVDNELNYIDRKTGKKVDKNGNPVEQLEKEIKRQIDNLQGDIKEEQPFVDDETGQPIVDVVEPEPPVEAAEQKVEVFNT